MEQTIREEKHTVHFQGCYFWGEAQVMGYERMKKMVQGNYTLDEKQSLPCQSWCGGPLLFVHRFLCFFLFLLLHNSGKLTITHDHMFLLLNILQVVLFKLLQRQDELHISGRANLQFFWNEFFAIYFWLSVLKSCPPCAAKMQRWLHRYWWQVKTLCW